MVKRHIVCRCEDWLRDDSNQVNHLKSHVSELSIDNYQLSIQMKFANYIILQSSVIETLGKYAYEWAHVK